MPQAVHREAVDLLDPHLELLRRAQLVQLVRRVDLPEEPAELVVAPVVLESHLRCKHSGRALHHVPQQPCAVLFLLKERPAQSGEEDEALQAALRAVGPLVLAASGEEVEEQLRDPVLPEHVPTVWHHHGALLVGGLVRDGAHEVEGQAVAGQLEDLLHQALLLGLLRDVDLPAGHLLQRLYRDREDCRQGGVAEAQGRPAEP
mmetsp:Transcript_102716/g.290821  ORF Transcript_102716/g.290821 Transcript_102716/m.290821 type:complete len:203 (-) Transcript_102716:613-1221(-)